MDHFPPPRFLSGGGREGVLEVLTCGPIFNEFVVRFPKSADAVNRKLFERRIIGGFPLERAYPELKNQMLLCATETKSKEARPNMPPVSSVAQRAFRNPKHQKLLKCKKLRKREERRRLSSISERWKAGWTYCRKLSKCPVLPHCKRPSGRRRNLTDFQEN